MSLWIFSLVLWAAVAALAATQQYVELTGTGKQLSWARAFAWQGLSWLLLAIATPVIFAVVRRWPVDRAHVHRVMTHLGASVLFGFLFLGIATPIRLAFHPSPMRWSFFGEAFYKSIPQFVGLGVLLYWAVVVVASLLETRARLYGTLERAEDAEQPPEFKDAPPPPPDWLVLTTPRGILQLPARDIAWAEPAAAGARLHMDVGAVPVRHSLSELETILAGHGFVRTHRSSLVNASRIREVLGGASRDGTVRLDTGDEIPVSRRRQEALRKALNGGPPAPNGAPLGD